MKLLCTFKFIAEIVLKALLCFISIQDYMFACIMIDVCTDQIKSNLNMFSPPSWVVEVFANDTGCPLQGK